MGGVEAVTPAALARAVVDFPLACEGLAPLINAAASTHGLRELLKQAIFQAKEAIEEAAKVLTHWCSFFVCSAQLSAVCLTISDVSVAIEFVTSNHVLLLLHAFHPPCTSVTLTWGHRIAKDQNPVREHH